MLSRMGNSGSHTDTDPEVDLKLGLWSMHGHAHLGTAEKNFKACNQEISTCGKSCGRIMPCANVTLSFARVFAAASTICLSGATVPIIMGKQIGVSVCLVVASCLSSMLAPVLFANWKKNDHILKNLHTFERGKTKLEFDYGSAFGLSIAICILSVFVAGGIFMKSKSLQVM